MSKLELTDKEIEKVARELTPNPNCRCLLETDLLNSELRLDQVRVCGGRLTFSKGKVQIVDACAEPCTFVCDTSREFANVIGLIQKVVSVINLVRE